MFMSLNKIGRANKRLVVLFAKQHPEYIEAVKQLLAHVRFPEFSRELDFNTRPCGTIKTTKSGQKIITLAPEMLAALKKFLTPDVEPSEDESSTSLITTLITILPLLPHATSLLGVATRSPASEISFISPIPDDLNLEEVIASRPVRSASQREWETGARGARPDQMAKWLQSSLERSPSRSGDFSIRSAPLSSLLPGAGIFESMAAEEEVDGAESISSLRVTTGLRR
ncbi:MAG: hypothetical protein A3E87_09200 [Gammaproteobacteria bacterium RIFCSPHIGHO2_12_FULL_35_23]|nr:MAG: hypothetical protein A3E87_09200 [Gammaproteobacteria bacterium RIFCSPHIGHO2_12_FULL_35_23]